jgi:hypothetical protein
MALRCKYLRHLHLSTRDATPPRPGDSTPADLPERLLTPEHSIDLQNSIGSDIIMQLDDVIQTTSPDRARMEEAMLRSVRWLDRCMTAHKRPNDQNLFCIIQGGLDLELRRECCQEMVKRDTPGIAVGGLSGGEAKSDFCKVYEPSSPTPQRVPEPLPTNPEIGATSAHAACRTDIRCLRQGRHVHQPPSGT